jgi:uncharacterized iron-regulated membrane protein
MVISNVNINPSTSNLTSSIVSNPAAPSVAGTQPSTNQSSVVGVQPSANQQASATVTLSAQGQQLSQSQANQIQTNQTQTNQSQTNQSQTSNTVDTPITPNAVPQSTETTAAPGIQFMAGESKGGHVNTFA